MRNEPVVNITGFTKLHTQIVPPLPMIKNTMMEPRTHTHLSKKMENAKKKLVDQSKIEIFHEMRGTRHLGPPMTGRD